VGRIALLISMCGKSGGIYKFGVMKKYSMDRIN
jgi:hypothetical protein